MRHRYNGGMRSSAKEFRLTEQRNPTSTNIDRMSSLEIIRLMNREDRKVAAAVEREVPAIARAVDAIVRALRSGGRALYGGAGSGRGAATLESGGWARGGRVFTGSVQGGRSGGAAAGTDGGA